MPARKKKAKPGEPGARPERTKRTVTIDGREYTVSEAARIVGISRNAMHQRLFKYGWTDEEATVAEKRPSPPRKPKLFLTVKTPDGPVKKSAKEWADAMPGDPLANLNRVCLRHRRGWSDAQALGIDPPPPRSRKVTWGRANANANPISKPTAKHTTKQAKGPTNEQD
jgi:hypothetical protein